MIIEGKLSRPRRQIEIARPTGAQVGYFHQWVVLNDRVYAIIELENGIPHAVRMRDIRFTDVEELDERKENEE